MSATFGGEAIFTDNSVMSVNLKYPIIEGNLYFLLLSDIHMCICIFAYIFSVKGFLYILSSLIIPRNRHESNSLSLFNRSIPHSSQNITNLQTEQQGQILDVKRSPLTRYLSPYPFLSMFPKIPSLKTCGKSLTMPSHQIMTAGLLPKSASWTQKQLWGCPMVVPLPFLHPQIHPEACEVILRKANIILELLLPAASCTNSLHITTILRLLLSRSSSRCGKGDKAFKSTPKCNLNSRNLVLEPVLLLPHVIPCFLIYQRRTSGIAHVTPTLCNPTINTNQVIWTKWILVGKHPLLDPQSQGGYLKTTGRA